MTPSLMEPRRDDRRLVRGRRFWLRRATAPARALPHFFVLGAMKSGTSSLFDYICQHRRVAPPFRKETHYLTLGARAGRGRGWYRAHFPLRASLGERITGEATPDYLFETPALDRLKGLCPSARLVVVLRDPVERAISHYKHEVRMGRETLPLAEAIATEEARIAHAETLGDAGLETVLHASYKRRGQYAEQLDRLFERFPRSRVLVVWSADLFSRPDETMAEVFRFLDLPPDDAPAVYGVKNAAPRDVETPGEVESALRSHFEPHDARLAALVGRPVPWS